MAVKARTRTRVTRFLAEVRRRGGDEEEARGKRESERGAESGFNVSCRRAKRWRSLAERRGTPQGEESGDGGVGGDIKDALGNGLFLSLGLIWNE